MRRSPRAVLALVLLAGVVGGADAVPARAAACANEVLRTELGSGFLPDCRAYEQLSPPYKEGFELLSIGYSHDGETAMLESYGAFAEAEAEGDSEGGLTAYAAHRTPSGWLTEPLDPPGASYPGQSIRAASADSGATLWQLHSRSQSPLEVELYERSPGRAGRRARCTRRRDTRSSRSTKRVFSTAGGRRPAHPDARACSRRSWTP